MIVVYAFRIQTIEGEKWRTLASELSTSYQTIDATRGNIYSDDGSLLATSVPVYDIRMDMQAEGLKDGVFNNGVDSLAYLLSKTFPEYSKVQFLRRLKQARIDKKRYFLVKRNVNFNQVKAMKHWPLFRLGKYKGGFVIIEKERRQQPFQLLAKRTIGYSRDGIAPVGLEGAYDEVLSGVSGKRLMQKVSGGQWIPVNYDNEIEPENGKDIYTTLDINIQDVAEEALLQALINHNAENGCAILMEVKTGRIKAIANLTRKGDGETATYTEAYNYAVGESAEPGSTFKLASLIALLESGVVSLEDSIDIESGRTKFFDRTMKDSEGSAAGKLTLQQSFEKSSNVGISKLVYEHFAKKPEEFVKLIKSLGIDKPLGLQIFGEGKPRIKSPEDRDWSGTTLPWMSIGYETTITPLQMLALYNAVANNGTMVKPVFAREVRHVGKLIEKYETQVLKKSICSKETLKKVRQAMEGVVLRGTARNLRNSNYSVAGKTGTAQIADAKNGYRKYYKSSFAGYFPANNPQYTCIVSINGASNGVYYGSLVAGPVFKEIADKVYASKLDLHLDIEERKLQATHTLPSPKVAQKDELKKVLNKIDVSSQTVGELDENQWVYTVDKETSLKIQERKVISGLVPNVVGMGLKDAMFLIENTGMKVRFTGSGKVRKQSISPGKKVVRGNTIFLELS
jgi:cell division protein FtsI (penicillin-binding protein 3)